MSKENPKNTAESYSYKFEELALQLREASDDSKKSDEIVDAIRKLAFRFHLDANIDIKFEK